MYSLINVVIDLQGNEEKIILEIKRDRIEAQARRLETVSRENAQLHDELAAKNARISRMLSAMERLDEQVQELGVCAHPVVPGSLVQP